MHARSIDRTLLRRQIRNQFLDEAKTKLAQQIAEANFKNPRNQINLIEELGKKEVKRIIDFVLINKINLNEVHRVFEKAIIRGEFTANKQIRDELLYEWGITKRSGVIKEGMLDMAGEVLFGFGPMIADLLSGVTGGATVPVARALGYGGMLFYGYKAAIAADKGEKIDTFVHMLGFIFSAQSAGVPFLGSAATAAGQGLMKILGPVFTKLKSLGSVIGGFAKGAVGKISPALGEKLAAESAEAGATLLKNKTMMSMLNKLSGGASEATKKAMELLGKIVPKIANKIPFLGPKLSANWAKYSATVMTNLEANILKSKTLGKLMTDHADEIGQKGVGYLSGLISAEVKLTDDAVEAGLKQLNLAKNELEAAKQAAKEMGILKKGADDALGKMADDVSFGTNMGKAFSEEAKYSLGSLGSQLERAKVFKPGSESFKAFDDALKRGWVEADKRLGAKAGKLSSEASSEITSGIYLITDDMAKLAQTSINQELKALGEVSDDLLTFTLSSGSSKVTGKLTELSSDASGMIAKLKLPDGSVKTIRGGQNMKEIMSSDAMKRVTGGVETAFKQQKDAALKKVLSNAKDLKTAKDTAAVTKVLQKQVDQMIAAAEKGKMASLSWAFGKGPRFIEKSVGKSIVYGMSAAGGDTEKVGQLPTYKRTRTDESLKRALRRKSLQILL